MRLFEAIIDANHRALGGDAKAGLHPGDYPDSLPIAALTCIDPRLNPLFPGALGLPAEQFIWLRNAGNIITGPLSSTLRSLALACAVKGGKEIAIIGHTDCQVSKSSVMKLTEAFKALGINRAALPENLNEYFGLFASERQNVIKATDFVRGSPVIGPRIPVHGLLIDVTTGKLEWIVNGYQTLESVAQTKSPAINDWAGEAIGALKSVAEFKLGEMKFPDTKIGEFGSHVRDFAVREIEQIQPPSAAPIPTAQPLPPETPAPTPPPPPLRNIPLPPRLRSAPNLRRPRKLD